MKIDRLLIMPLMSSTILFATNVLSQNHVGISNTNKNPAVTRQYASFSINNLSSWLRADGLSSHSPSAQGTIFPRGTAVVIYQDGILWGGKAYLDAAKTQPAPFGQIIRVGGSQYLTGCRAGRIIGFGANAVPADTNAADSRIYRIRRDYASLSIAELRREAAAVSEIDTSAVTNAQMLGVLGQYDKDWKEWPVPYGAPYIDRNRNGKYDPPPPFSKHQDFTVDSLIAGNYDEPGVAGADPNFPADQVIWTVYNDLDRNQSTRLFGSEPLGLEAQVTLWGYKNSPGAGDFFFRRTRLINKGGVAIDDTGTKGAFYIDSLYFGQWADGDLGNFADDLHGCDTLRNMGYFYNSSGVDKDFRKYNLPPPAAGYDIVQGPRVLAPNASAIFDLQRLLGWKNLGMTSFSPKSTGSAISDPPGGSYQFGTLRWYKWLRGFVPTDGPELLYSFPPGVTPNFFPLSGDPVAGTGFIDGLGTVSYYSLGPGDRRMTVSSGPIRFAPGDTQEVVVAVVAGLGADRLSSILAMRQIDDTAQFLYNSLLANAAPPQFSVDVTYPSAALATLKIKATSLPASYQAIRVTLWRQHRVQLAETQLFDDGAHEDGSADDGVFVNSLTLSREKEGLYLDALVTDRLQRSSLLARAADLITTSGNVTLRHPVIFSDNLNNDGMANPGENVRYGFSIQNATDWELPGLRIIPAREYFGKSLAIKQIGANNELALNYNPADANTFFSFEAPASYSDSTFRIAFNLYDQNYNRWEQTLSFPVVPLHNALPTAQLPHVAGKANGSFEIRLIDPRAIKNHLYAIYGVDAIDTSGTKGITLKDSTDGRLLLFKHPLPDTLGHNMSVTDGFKILRGSIPDQTKGGMEAWSIPHGRRVWTWENANGFNLEGFNGAMGLAALVIGFFDGSTVTSAKARDVLIKFTATDTAGNVLNPNDADWSFGYRYLRFGTTVIPPEFAPFIKNRGVGYSFQDYTKSVPFSAWDIEANPPRRLMVGHLENVVLGGLVDGKYWPSTSAKNNTATTGPREWFFIFDVPYGETSDSRLTQNILGSQMPIIWFGTPNRNGNIAFQTGDEFLIQAIHFVTSRDVWVFNPTLVGITDQDHESFTFELAQNYPNPFNPSTQIAFSIPAAEKVTLKLYNMLGQEVATLVDQKLAAGKHRFVWDGTTREHRPLASGVYFYRLIAGELQATKKLLLLR